MGMVHWVKQVIQTVLPTSIGQGAQEFEKKGKANLVDLTDGYQLVEEAKKWGANIFRSDHRDLDEVREKIQMRRKIKKGIAQFYNQPDLLDEVTERVYDASRFDSRLRRFFS